ncbi:hypothetical protein AHAS_Ahas03G0317700 [Arachis hypogaea]
MQVWMHGKKERGGWRLDEYSKVALIIGEIDEDSGASQHYSATVWSWLHFVDFTVARVQMVLFSRANYVCDSIGWCPRV